MCGAGHRQSYDSSPHVLVKVFGCMTSFNSFFPSERQIANSIRIGKPIALDNSWKLSISTHAETAVADICEKIYQDNFDDDLKDRWKDMRTDRPTFEVMCDACSKLADARAEVQAATLQDNREGACQEPQCKGPFDTNWCLPGL